MEDSCQTVDEQVPIDEDHNDDVDYEVLIEISIFHTLHDGLNHLITSSQVFNSHHLLLRCATLLLTRNVEL